jgi:metal-sulfur cluster biosynthetic enzyme
MTNPASLSQEARMREQVLDALSAVYDPELDEPITSLRFVSSCVATADGDVEVLLRLAKKTKRKKIEIKK